MAPCGTPIETGWRSDESNGVSTLIYRLDK